MTPTFQDEVQLAGWSETHTGGAKVTFWLPDTAALDVFRTLTARKGNTAGHRFACVLVEIGDDEKPVEPEAGNPASVPVTEIPVSEKPKGGEWAKLAGMWCNDPDFWMFLRHAFTEDVRDSGDAVQIVKEMSGIFSRAELDHDTEALRKFNEQIRHPFMKFMQARGIKK